MKKSLKSLSKRKNLSKKLSVKKAKTRTKLDPVTISTIVIKSVTGLVNIYANKLQAKLDTVYVE